jgi:hypothetical protein
MGGGLGATSLYNKKNRKIIVKFISIFIFFIIIIACGSSASDSTKKIKPNWRLNDHKVLNSTNKLFINDTSLASNVQLNITVNDIKQEYYILSLTFNKYENTTHLTSEDYNMIHSRLSQMIIGLTMELKFNLEGDYLDFINWEEVKSKLYAVIDSIASEIKNNNVETDDDLVEDIQRNKMMFAEKNVFEKGFLVNLLTYFQAYKLEYNEEKPIEIKEPIEIPNISDAFYYIRKIECYGKTDSLININESIFFPEEQIDKIKSLSNNQPDNYIYSALLAMTEIETQNEYIIDNSSKWVIYSKFVNKNSTMKKELEFKLK